VSGIRYIQKPLGYPKERNSKHNSGEMRRIHIQTRGSSGMEWAESPPLALIWGADQYN
jgi:hypothetical protein